MPTSLAALAAVLGLAPAFAPSAQEASTGRPPEPDERIAQHSNRLGWTLFEALNPRGDDAEPTNSVLSPWSIHAALSMLAPGARGEARAALEQVLGYSGSGEGGDSELAARIAAYAGRLEPAEDRRGEPFWQQAVGNRAFVDPAFAVEPHYRELLESVVGAGIERLDLRAPTAVDRINAWIEETTRGNIRDMLDGVPPQNRMVLANAVWLKAAWADAFLAEATKPAAFDHEWWTRTNQPLRVAMMQRQGSWRHAQTATAHFVEVPFRGGQLAMVLVVPKRGHHLYEIREGIPAEFERTVAALRPATVDLEVPRFTIEPETRHVGPALADAGLASIFGAGADWSGITRDESFSVDLILHAARIVVDEAGTEAAAATVVMKRGSILPADGPQVKVVADQPFLFALRHLPTGTNLFVGQVVRPEVLTGG